MDQYYLSSHLVISHQKLATVLKITDVNDVIALSTYSMFVLNPANKLSAYYNSGCF